MAFEDAFILNLQYQVCKTFNLTSCSFINLTNIVDAVIAFPLLTYAIYTFLGKIAPFRNVNNAVYMVIAAAMAGAVGFFGGFLFQGGVFVSLISVGAIAAFSNWEKKKKLRFALTAWFLLVLFYSFFGTALSSLGININTLRIAIMVLAVINILLSDLPIPVKILLTVIVLAIVFVFWSQIISALSSAGYGR